MSEPIKIETKFKDGEIVWAKVKGHPWWPGMVQNVHQKSLTNNSRINCEYQVAFLGEKSHSKLSMDKLAKFDSNFKKFAYIKKSKLAASIQSAHRIIAGASTLQQEYDNLSKKNNSQKKQDKLQLKSNGSSSKQQSSESEFTNDRQSQKKLKLSQTISGIADDCACQVDAKLRHALSTFINGQINHSGEDLLIDLNNCINLFFKECIEITVNAKRSEAVTFAFKRQWGALFRELLKKILQKGSISLEIVEDMTKQQQKLIEIIHKFFDNELDQPPKEKDILSQIIIQKQQSESIEAMSWGPTPKKQKSKNSAHDTSESYNESENTFSNNIKQSSSPQILKIGELSNNEQCQSISSAVQDPHLRKKVCQHIASLLQNKYNLEKKKSQNLTLCIESKIRMIDVSMKQDYREKIKIIFKLLKNETLSDQQIYQLGERNFVINFEYLNQHFQEANQMPVQELNLTK